MKVIGITRRMDDLGRVVIPREIRTNMHIREGDPLELFIENGGVLFKKYSALSPLAYHAAHIQKVLNINGIFAFPPFVRPSSLWNFRDPGRMV
jgi:AbrB family transcriptional regulator (stage V sporulation protein T)